MHALRRFLHQTDRALRAMLMLAARTYRLLLAPFIAQGCCRFTPSCSHYASEALETHSLPRALWLIFRRVSRCRPYGGEGYDPVPSAHTNHSRPMTDTL